ncbi:uncharacterized protein LOC125665599 [Ostrea edulis]|uniref:uncharacterized protein LOC125665599 n=1 Tax=Ostrea edulis TaxID=37623 RepID=UPI0020948FEF|nr:uncharacterized protein LOC125665599 [Ostrea edulis]XP_056008304.1 uncharacterized protein LOC125665599 [Ostrea edulis]XP_056008305.1 uncharacterized protein LOC125665599 [Ostrea edulis]
MRKLVPLWCILELCSLAISQHEQLFRLTKDGRANSNHSNTVNIHNFLEAERRKDYIRRQICHILQCNSKAGPPPPTSTLKPPVPKDNIADNPILSEPADFTNDTSCMQFPIPIDYLDPNVKLGDGDIQVFIKVKKRKNRRKRKVSLKVSLIEDSSNQTVIASRKFKLRKTEWQNIHLPSVLIKSIQRRRMRVLRVCIRCIRCRKVRVEFPLKIRSKRRRKKKSRGRKMRKRKLRKNRPRLLLFSKRVESSVRNRRHTLNDCKCCKHARFVPFSSLQLPHEVAFPNGFTYEECTQTCEKNNVMLQSYSAGNDPTTCNSVEKKPLNLNIKYKDGIEFTLAIPNARVTKCQCHIQ